MTDTPFSQRELRDKFFNIEDKLEAILKQTTQTNGRVSKLETRMLMAFTAIGVTVALKFPELLAVLKFAGV